MKRGTPDHPKIKRLAASLGVSRATAIGTLEMLAHFAARYAIQGDVGRWSDQEIADAVDWSFDATVLVAALVDVRLLDHCCDVHRVVIHDWQDHADESVRKTLKKRRLDIIVPGHSTTDREESPTVLESSRRVGDRSLEIGSASGTGTGSGSSSSEEEKTQRQQQEPLATSGGSSETVTSTRARVATLAPAVEQVEDRVRRLCPQLPPNLLPYAVVYFAWSSAPPPVRELRAMHDELTAVGHTSTTITTHLRVYFDASENPDDDRFKTLPKFTSTFSLWDPKHPERRRRPPKLAASTITTTRSEWDKAPRRLREIATALATLNVPKCDRGIRQAAEQELAALSPSEAERTQAEALLTTRARERRAS